MNLTDYRHLSIPWLVMRDGLRFMLEGSGEFEVAGQTQGRRSTPRHFLEVARPPDHGPTGCNRTRRGRARRTGREEKRDWAD